jgi:hypothetical protein
VRRLLPRWGLFGAGLVVLACAFAYWFIPATTNDRAVRTGTPVPVARGEAVPVRVPAAGRACMTDVGLTARTDLVVLNVATRGRRPSPLVLEAAAPGYRASARFPRYEDGKDVAVRLAHPRSDVVAELCVVNTGERSVWLRGTTEPQTAGRSETRVDGELQGVDVSMVLLHGEPASLTDEAGDLMSVMTTWKPGFVWTPLLWILLALVVVGVPLGALWAFGPGAQRPPDEPGGAGDG